MFSLAALSVPFQNGIADSRILKRFPYQADLKTRAVAAFRRFEEVWEFNDFWKRGNTFDACLVFADALHRRWPRDTEVISIQKAIDGMLEKNYAYFTSFDAGKMWADDFGWWGLMSIHARKHLLRSGDIALANKYSDLGIRLCWQQERDHAYDFTNAARPVPHGCRNGDANGQNKGVKNTVTNVLLFLLSCRIYRLTLEENLADNEKYLEMAYRQWVWFDSWFQLVQYGYMQKVKSGGGLVQERPTAFFNSSDYADITHPTWEKGWVWSGDQGMLVAALTEMLAIKNELATWIEKNKIDPRFRVDTFVKTANRYLSLLKTGIRSALVSNADGIIREAPFKASFGPEFGNDYLAGRGIMMRYLGGVGKEQARDNFDSSIRTTADAIWRTRDKVTNQFRPEFTMNANDKMYVAQYRNLTGLGDDVHKWQIDAMNEQQKFGVCQSIGLDALGAALNGL